MNRPQDPPFEPGGVSRTAAVTAVAAVVVVAVVVAAVLDGWFAARGAVVGGLLGAAFVSAGPWMLKPLIRDNPTAAMPAAVALFLGKAIVAAGVLFAIDSSASITDWLSIRALVFTLVAVVLVSLNLQILDFANRRTLTYDLDEPTD